MATSDLELFSDYYWISPYVFSSYVALVEKGLDFKVTEIKLQEAEQKKEDYQSQTITGRVPALRHGDFYLAESVAIIEYLEDSFSNSNYPKLLPTDTKQKARARQILNWVRSDLLNLRSDRDSASVLYVEERKDKPLSEKGAVDANKLVKVAQQLIPEDSGPIFGVWTMTDADLTFMLKRLHSNGDPLPEKVKKYVEIQWSRPSVQQFVQHKRPPYVRYY